MTVLILSAENVERNLFPKKESVTMLITTYSRHYSIIHSYYRMVQFASYLNCSLTDEYSPIFEIIYITEVTIGIISN